MAASNPIDFATLDIVLETVKDALLLRGPHGIGKSAVPAKVSKRTGMRLLDVRLSLFTEGDLVGVPDHERIKEHEDRAKRELASAERLRAAVDSVTGAAAHLASGATVG